MPYHIDFTILILQWYNIRVGLAVNKEGSGKMLSPLTGASSLVWYYNRRTHCLLIQSTLCEKGIYSIHRSVFKTQHLALSIETINNLRERSINALSLYKTNQKMLLGYIFCISVIHFIKKQFNTQEDVDVKCSFIYFNEKTILMLKIIFDFFCPDV